MQPDAAVVLGGTDCFRCLSTLRQLSVSFPQQPELRTLSILSLSNAAARGVRVELCLRLNWADSDRMGLFTTLAGSPQLACVTMIVKGSGCRNATPAELRVLDSIHFGELVLRLQPEESLALLLMRSEQLSCLLPSQFSEWDAITMRQGIFPASGVTDASLEALLTRCASTPPDFSEGWALALKLQPHQHPTATAHGLRPWGQGWLVWRNSAVSNAMLKRTCELLYLGIS